MIFLYTCCPDSKCGGYKSGYNFLNSWGIEPAIKSDGENHYFEFEIPEEWSDAKTKKFNEELDSKSTKPGKVLFERLINIDMPHNLSPQEKVQSFLAATMAVGNLDDLNFFNDVFTLITQKMEKEANEN